MFKNIVVGIVVFACALIGSPTARAGASLVPTPNPALELKAYKAVNQLRDFVDSKQTAAENPEKLIGIAEDAINLADKVVPKDKDFQILVNISEKLVEAARFRYAGNLLAELRKIGMNPQKEIYSAKEWIKLLEEAIANAKLSNSEEAVKLEVQLPELKKKARAAYAKAQVELLQTGVSNPDKLSGSTISDADSAIIYALRAGDDATELWKRFQKLKAQACVAKPQLEECRP